ncbi:excalibur calcium-binding domain-containing protein [Deinococcus radiophilus]|uniref:excalibur calcium-binding domain-containing protein n=1 Tax=Deinococcus radiophilus TaxID=32062 RepID=UPI00360E570E
MVILGAAMGGGDENTDTVSQTEIAQEAPAQEAAPQPLVSEVPAEETEAAEPAETEPEAEEVAPVEAEPEVAVADELLALGNVPDALNPQEHSTEQDRHYYSWDRPNLGETVNMVWRAPDDWWFEIEGPAFTAGDLGDLELADGTFSRLSTGPLAGVLALDNGPIVMHLQTQKYYDAEQALFEESSETVAEPLPLAATEEVPAEVYFANCSEAEAAGYSNMTPSDPGYRPKLDGDSDGLACES